MEKKKNYEGKFNKIDRDLFIEAMNLYAQRKLSQAKAAKHCGLSIPTFTKYCKIEYENAEKEGRLIYWDDDGNEMTKQEWIDYNLARKDR